MERRKVLLTPDLAREMLEHNYSKNRRIRMHKVLSIAADIKAGRWNESISEYDSPISLTADGILINGQHRCMAVIEANIPVWTWINYGVPIDCYELFDGVAPRSVSDILDCPNANYIASLAKFSCAVEDGDAPLSSSLNGVMQYSGKRQGITATRAQQVEKGNENIDYFQYIFSLAIQASRYLAEKRGPISKAFYLIDYVGRGVMLEDFAKENGKLKPDSDVVYACRTYMTQKIITKTFKATDDWIMGCIFCAYDHFIENTDVNSFNKYDHYFKKYNALMVKTRIENRRINK